MRNHGWQPPFHPLQTVAIAVFCMLTLSFYVFFAPFLGSRVLKLIIIGVFTPVVGAVSFLYIACTWIDPADPDVLRSKFNPKKQETRAGGSGDEEMGPEGATGDRKSMQDHLEVGNGQSAAGTLCTPLEWCKRKRKPADQDSEEEKLYCSICDADISTHTKHCRACDKCVHGFDHHCRWLNNCVGTRNYKPFVALMVSCLLMLMLEWAVGIVVLVRCFSNKTAFDVEITDQLGRSFPRVAFIIVVMILTLLAFLVTAPLTQLFFFHLILMHKGITTYDYILAVREENQEFWEENGTSSLTTSPATSTETGFSGYNSSASKRVVFCTPPRIFVDQDQTIMALSDLEVGAGKAGAGKIVDAKPKPKPGQVGINPWKLAKVTTEDAARAGARARAKSSILHPARPPGASTEPAASPTVDTDSSAHSGGEIRLAGRRSRRAPRTGTPRPGLAAEASDSLNPASSLDAPAPLPLPLEPRSPYRSSPSPSLNPNEVFSGDPRASFPVPQGPFPLQVLIPRFPGDVGSSQVGSSESSLRPPGLPVPPRTSAAQSSVDALRISVTSDGYEASCGESGDDTSDAVGLSQSWNNLTGWSKFGKTEQVYKEEDVKPWVATFPAGSSVADVVGTPGGQSAVSSGSRVEANILKANPELQHARLQQSSSPSVYDESPLRESSDFLSEDTTTSYGDAQPDRSTMSSFFYTGPECVRMKATGERQGVSQRMVVNPIILTQPGLPRVTTDDPKLLDE